MEEKALEIYKYFPRTNDEKLSLFTEHHLKHFNECMRLGLYSSGFSHLHILYIVFIYIQILRISREKTKEFHYCWIGFPGQEKDFLKNPTSPFSFSAIKEKSVFRFFRLLNFDDHTIGSISSLVNDRNTQMHASGEIRYNSEKEFEKIYDEYINKINIVIHLQTDFLTDIYNKLVSTYDVDYVIEQDDIDTNFSSQYYFSLFELENISEGRIDPVSNFIRANK